MISFLYSNFYLPFSEQMAEQVKDIDLVTPYLEKKLFEAWLPHEKKLTMLLKIFSDSGVNR